MFGDILLCRLYILVWLFRKVGFLTDIDRRHPMDLGNGGKESW